MKSVILTVRYKGYAYSRRGSLERFICGSFVKRFLGKLPNSVILSVDTKPFKGATKIFVTLDRGGYLLWRFPRMGNKWIATRIRGGKGYGHAYNTVKDWLLDFINISNKEEAKIFVNIQ
jgi:hypothetical protein